MSKRVPLHSRREDHVGEAASPHAFTGVGIVPDVLSEHGLTTFPAANRTTLEHGFIPGQEGMMPPPGVQIRVSPATLEGGTGGAGSFNSSFAAPVKRVSE